MRTKRFFLDTWYGPVIAWCIVAVAVLAHMALDALLQCRMPRLLGQCLGWTLLILLAVATLFNIAVFLFALSDKKWKCATLQFLTGVVAVAGFALGFSFLMLVGLFGAGEDHFAEDLTIPPEVETDIVVPEKEISTYFGAVDIYDDDFAKAIFKNADQKGSDDPNVTCDLSALADLVHNRHDELMAYLARHPGWWLHEDRGRLCATRRLRVRGVWNHPLHGYYSGHVRERGTNEDFKAYQRATHFQTRTTIGFPHSPFGRNRGAEHPAAATVKAKLEGNLGTRSSCVSFGDKEFCVEVFEESAAKDRRITNAALAFLRDEFASLKLPDDAVKRGPEEFVLRNGMQPGIYNLTLRINPGESGIVYLKAFEVTKGTRLSENRIFGSSNERVGWSANPEEKFLYENEFTIYEGDWGEPYAARIEAWFRPDSGKTERKLTERVCKVEGWQR